MLKFKHFSDIDKKNLFVDIISAIFYGIFIGSINPFIPIILKKNQSSPIEIGLVLAAPFLSFIITFYFYPIYSRFNPIDVVTLPSTISRFSATILGFVINKNYLVVIVYLLIQLVEGLSFPAYSKVMKDCYSNSARNFAMSYVRTMLGITTIITSIVAGKLLDSNLHKIVFAAAAVCGTISAINFRRLILSVNSTYQKSTNNKFNFKQIFIETFSNKKFRILNITVFLYGFGNLLLYGILPTILVEKFNVSNYLMGVLSSVTSVVQVISYPIIAIISSKYDIQNAFLFGLSAGLPIVWIISLSYSTNALFIVYALFGVMYSSFDICVTLLIMSFVESGEVMKFSAVYTFLLGIRGTLATLTSNIICSYTSFDKILLVSGLLNFLGFTFGVYYKPYWKPTKSK